MSNSPWHLRRVRSLVFVGLAIALIGIVVACMLDQRSSVPVGVRQLTGLWALGLLLTSMVVGPLTSVVRGIPIQAHLILGRRAVGIGAFVFAAFHAASYTGPLLAQGGVSAWVKAVTSEGALWIAGIALGALTLPGLAVLAVTSNDRMMMKMGGARWKALHRLVYVILPLAFLHALLIGADFGFNRGSDVTTAPDAGSLIGMSLFVTAWLTLFVLRRQGRRFEPFTRTRPT